jgi:hypothetical protein
MARLSLWRGEQKTRDFTFTDRIISEFFGISGTALYIHRYLGVHDQRTPSDDPDNPLPEVDTSVLTIQDVLFLENRDRKYADEIVEMRGVYNVQDNDFDLRQFGLFLTNDNLFIEVHLNDMLAMVGRKLMAGDVIELPHQRDDALLDENAKAINKFYVVEDGNRASAGYSATWFPHIWRIKVSPMTGAQEYADILNKQAENPFGVDQGLIGDLMTTMARDMAINEEIVEAATASVSGRYFEDRQFWIMPGDKGGPCIYHGGDGVPPNGSVLTGTGTQFPMVPGNGDYFLRTDYEPKTLFQFESGKWRIRELDWRQGYWDAAALILRQFINDTETSNFSDGTSERTRQGLSKAVKPKADF